MFKVTPARRASYQSCHCPRLSLLTFPHPLSLRTSHFIVIVSRLSSTALFYFNHAPIRGIAPFFGRFRHWTCRSPNHHHYQSIRPAMHFGNSSRRDFPRVGQHHMGPKCRDHWLHLPAWKLESCKWHSTVGCAIHHQQSPLDRDHQPPGRPCIFIQIRQDQHRWLL